MKRGARSLGLVWPLRYVTVVLKGLGFYSVPKVPKLGRLLVANNTCWAHAVRLHMQDSAGKNIALLLISSYAPVSNASRLEWDNHCSSLEQLMDLKKAGDILLIGADCNASIGCGSGCGSGCGPDTRMSTGVKAVGAYGIAHTNNSGGQLRSFLELNTLVATSTHFRKQSYGTWVSPCSKLPHQLDHFLTHASDFKRVKDAGVKAPLIGSDHVAVCCKLRIHVRLGRKRDLRNEITKMDFAMLQGEGGEHIRANIAYQVSESLTDSPNPPYAKLAKVLGEAAKVFLPLRSGTALRWFQASATTLRPLVDARNAAHVAYQHKSNRRTGDALKEARTKLQAASRAAKPEWILHKYRHPNGGLDGSSGTKTAWQVAQGLKQGLGTPRL